MRSSNFKVEIGNLPCDNVTKAELPSAEQGFSEIQNSFSRTNKSKLPELKLTLPMSDFEPWSDWVNEVVASGDQGQQKELNGSISIMNQDFTSELGRFEIFECGPLALRPLMAQARADDPAMFEIELYVNHMVFKLY